MAKSPVVLSFHEILLDRSDVGLLEGPYWLNDKIISFYFQYLEKVVFSHARELLFVAPEVTQCIKMVHSAEIKIFLEPLDIDHKKFIFFALNDNDSESAGGSHWSLLVYSKPESCFFHFDSSSDSNHNVAWNFASHLISYLSKNGGIDFVSKNCTQQSNGHDCGIHVICNTEKLADYAHVHNQIDSCNMSEKINPNLKRKEILYIIRNLPGFRHY